MAVWSRFPGGLTLAHTPATLQELVRARFLAFLLILSLLPATTELIEAVVHYVEHGDLAHAEADEHGTTALGMSEHGCSGTFHLCSCHTAIAVTPTIAGTLTPIDRADALAPLRPPSREGKGASAPDIRPPIA